jgi:hypothetical protein
MYSARSFVTLSKRSVSIISNVFANELIACPKEGVSVSA